MSTTKPDLIEACVRNEDVAKGIKLAYDFLTTDKQGIMSLKEIIEWLENKEEN